MAEKIARLIDGLLGLLTGLLAAVLILYSGYVLYDNFYTNRNAFASWDLLQYKPTMDIQEDPGFQELQQINPDVIGWLTVYDTHIDYPVLQGDDNLEYVNKDVYGNFSLPGSIYLATENSRDFSDGYSLIYGHHMDNGAMFGDIDKFADPAFFQAHSVGLLQTPAGNYDLRAYACVHTDAYESLIYDPGGSDAAWREALLSYIRANAVTYDQAIGQNVGKLIALSTCADIDTNGRIVLFVSATPRTAPVETVEAEPEQRERRVAVGHGTQVSSWALLNLVSALLTLFTLLPLGNLRVKFRQFGYTRRKVRELAGAKDEEQRRVLRDLRRFRHKLRAGLVLEMVVAAAAAGGFWYTEDILRNMVISDRWTPVMIGLFALALLIDFICFRYRGTRPAED